MTNTRRKRVRPIKKSRGKPAYQKAKKRAASTSGSRPKNKTAKRPRIRKTVSDRSMRDMLINGAIGLVVLINCAGIYYFVRQCAGRPAAEAVTAEAPEEKLPEPPPFRQIQIEVLNGCGTSGVANRYTNYLRQHGFDVVKTDNYEEEPGRSNFNVLETVVVDRRGERESAMRVVRALELGETRLLQAVNAAYLIDATVIIGKDYSNVPAWNKMEP